MQLDMTKGRPLPVILRFTIPLVIGNVFQQLYNMADTIIVGRYVGAGALAAGGIISLIKSLPMIVRTFTAAFKSYGKGAAGTLRTEQDISMKVVLAVCLLIAVFMWLFPAIPVSFLGALIVLVFGFFFATVSSRA